MKKNLVKTALAFGLTAIMLLGATTAALASETTVTPAVERTRAWDSIKNTLGGIPESVRKVEYAGSVFYLGEDVTDTDFLTVLEAGPEAVRLKPPKENGKLYMHPVYIMWNSDKTALLVHPIAFDYDKIIEDVAIPAELPASLTSNDNEEQKSIEAVSLSIQESNVKMAPIKGMTKVQTVEYMLSVEYTEAVRNEFYRLLNEHRAAHGLRELEINLELQDYADIRAEEQSIQSGHTRPNRSAAGSGWHGSRNTIDGRYAENSLATGTLHPDPLNTARGIFSIWKESKGHNRHMLYDFKPEITMGFGIVPKLDDDGFVTSGAIFASGY